MNAALNAVEEIREIKRQLDEAKSEKRRRDLQKHFSECLAELREYCGYRNFDFQELIKTLKNV